MRTFAALIIAVALVTPTDAQGQPILRRGATGAAVRTLQTRLNAWIARNPTAGLTQLPVNGTFGPATERTVIAFQRANRLPQTGVVASLTWARLLGTSASPVQPAAPPAAPPRANCDPSYPTLCIPPGAFDLDCPEIPQRRFPVRGADRHRFDGDNDGIGCER